MLDIADIEQNFAYLDDWEDRYRYVIELGRELDPLAAEAHSEANRVRGCVSQVWLETAQEPGASDPKLTFKGDSDAHIVRGLIAIVLAIYSGKRAREIAGLDAAPVLHRLGLDAHLTPQRSNGVRAMIDRIRKDGALASAPSSD